MHWPGNLEAQALDTDMPPAWTSHFPSLVLGVVGCSLHNNCPVVGAGRKAALGLSPRGGREGRGESPGEEELLPGEGGLRWDG